MIGAAVSSYFALQATNRANLAESRRIDLETANSQLAAANEEANKKRGEAEASADVARHQTQLALKSLHSVIFDLQRGLENVPGSGEVRRKLLRTALDGLKQVSESFASRAVIDRNTLVALDELGSLARRLSANEHSTLEVARDLHSRALEIALQLAESNPMDPLAQLDASISHMNLGDVITQMGNVDGAREQYMKGVAIREKLAEAHPESVQVPTFLAGAYHSAQRLTPPDRQRIKELEKAIAECKSLNAQ
jgi:tetratricopeptide (TPR) repeat protein